MLNLFSTKGWEPYYKGKHVLITGASEGVGLTLAKRLVAAGARVTLMARTKSKLVAAEAACLEQQPAGAQQQAPRRTFLAPADVTNEEEVTKAVTDAQAALGQVDVLIACAGGARCGYFHETDSAAHRHMMDLNYMGVVHVVKAVLPGMIKQRQGHLIVVASTLSLMGAIGYCAYAPSKYAVRGLMESLRNELQGTGVRVSICYPPDMDTPGYAKEGLHKPIESVEVSGQDQVFPPDQVALSILSGAAKGKWVLPNVRLDVAYLQDLTLGLVPRQNVLLLLWQMLECLFGPLICWLVVAGFDAIARRHAARRYARIWGEEREGIAAAAGDDGAAAEGTKGDGVAKGQTTKRRA